MALDVSVEDKVYVETGIASRTWTFEGLDRRFTRALIAVHTTVNLTAFTLVANVTSTIAGYTISAWAGTTAPLCYTGAALETLSAAAASAGALVDVTGMESVSVGFTTAGAGTVSLRLVGVE